MPAPASTTWPARKPAAAANGTTALSGCWPRELAAPVAALLAPFLEVVNALNERGRLKTYPGSPALARAWLRPQDRLIACELEPRAAAALRQNLRGDVRIKTLEIDGWTALGAYVPPNERRGLVLVDPPFEQDGDFVRLVHGLAAAHRKWATGIYALWYPIKGSSERDALAKSLRRQSIGKILRAELTVAPLSDPARLNGCGMILVNPPWTLESELSVLLPALAGILGRDGKGAFRLDWLSREGAPRRPVTLWALSTRAQLVCSSVIGRYVPPPGWGPAE